MTTGTFGFGIIRIGTGDIDNTDYDRTVPVNYGTFEFWWSKLMLSYSRTVLGGLSLGVNFNSNRQVMLNNSANGFGFDVGAHYRFLNSNGFLKTI